MADTAKDWRRNMPHHSYTSGSKEVPACVMRT